MISGGIESNQFAQIRLIIEMKFGDNKPKTFSGRKNKRYQRNIVWFNLPFLMQ